MDWFDNRSFADVKFDPRSIPYCFEKDGRGYIVFAKTDRSAKENLEMALAETGQATTFRGVGQVLASLRAGHGKEFLDRHTPDKITTIIVNPYSDQTDVYIIRHLPPEIVELLSTPLPDLEDPGYPRWRALNVGEWNRLAAAQPGA